MCFMHPLLLNCVVHGPLPGRVLERHTFFEAQCTIFLSILERFLMVKMNIQSEPENLQISKLNEFLLVADRIRKAGHSARRGFNKFKCKPNPNGDGAQLFAPTSTEGTSFTNGSFAPPVQSSHVFPIAPSVPPSGDPLSKEERNTIRTLEIPATLSRPTRCPPPNWMTHSQVPG